MADVGSNFVRGGEPRLLVRREYGGVVQVEHPVPGRDLPAAGAQRLDRDLHLRGTLVEGTAAHHQLRGDLIRPCGELRVADLVEQVGSGRQLFFGGAQDTPAIAALAAMRWAWARSCRMPAAVAIAAASSDATWDSRQSPASR